MKLPFQPFRPEMSPDQYKEIMRKIEECEERAA